MSVLIPDTTGLFRHAALTDSYPELVVDDTVVLQS
jgi:hypothetical protein